MISKDEILRSFPKEDIEEVLKVYQTMNLAYSKGITTFTNFFCKPNIWNYFIAFNMVCIIGRLNRIYEVIRARKIPTAEEIKVLFSS